MDGQPATACANTGRCNLMVPLSMGSAQVNTRTHTLPSYMFIHVSKLLYMFVCECISYTLYVCVYAAADSETARHPDLVNMLRPS